MVDQANSRLPKQIAAAARRLFWQTLLSRMAWCWVVALALSAMWFLVQPILLADEPVWLRWTVAGGILGVFSIIALILAFRSAPSRLAAALVLDERFGLKERVTTALSLTEEQQATSAGQAVWGDAEHQVGSLDVASRFPLRLTGVAGLVPLGAALLVMIALFYQPQRGTAKAETDPLDQKPVNAVEIARKMRELKKKRVRARVDKPKSKELKEIELEIEKIANRPANTRRDLQQRIKEMTSLEDRIKARQRQLAERADGIQDRLRRLNGLENMDGPARELEKAMNQGDFKKAQEEFDKLAKKLQKNELSKKEQEQLAKQLEGLQEQLQRLSKLEDEKERLKQLAKDGKLDQETLDRELERLQRESESLKDLQDLAQKLGECQKCLKEGNSKEALERLQQAAKQLESMELTEQELQDLQEQMQKLQSAKQACCQGDQQGKDGRGNSPGGKGNGKGDTNQPNLGGIGAGRRPEGKDGKYGSFDARQKAHFDKKGRVIFAGHAPGKTFKAKSGPELAGEIQQASQEAPESIERQRIPKGARDVAKEYFRNLGNQK